MARHGYNRAVPTNTDYSGNCIIPTETEAELETYRKEKLALIDDFLVGRNKLKGEERKQFRKALDNIHTIRGIDLYFRRYLDTHM